MSSSGDLLQWNLFTAIEVKVKNKEGAGGETYTWKTKPNFLAFYLCEKVCLGETDNA